MPNIFPVSESVKEYFREKYSKSDESSHTQELIAELKNRGCSQMQTVFLFVNEGGVSFTEANRIVLNSDAWQ